LTEKGIAKLHHSFSAENTNAGKEHQEQKHQKLKSDLKKIHRLKTLSIK